ncbi:MAG: hypothetical protein ABSG68_18080, partial [Thermoguttaceae bacterium]
QATGDRTASSWTGTTAKSLLTAREFTLIFGDVVDLANRGAIKRSSKVDEQDVRVNKRKRLATGLRWSASTAFEEDGGLAALPRCGNSRGDRGDPHNPCDSPYGVAFWPDLGRGKPRSL